MVNAIVGVRDMNDNIDFLTSIAKLRKLWNKWRCGLSDTTDDSVPDFLDWLAEQANELAVEKK